MVVVCKERETIKTSRKFDILIKCGVNCKIDNLIHGVLKSMCIK